MKRVLAAVWAYLRELSGEAALERRMGDCSCKSRREAVTHALKERFEGTQRCC
ncbi:MAG TPA: hypothetical protein V6D47_21890 [Oscillatoriaceae cyanobacterium]